MCPYLKVESSDANWQKFRRARKAASFFLLRQEKIKYFVSINYHHHF